MRSTYFILPFLSYAVSLLLENTVTEHIGFGSIENEKMIESSCVLASYTFNTVSAKIKPTLEERLQQMCDIHLGQQLRTRKPRAVFVPVIIGVSILVNIGISYGFFSWFLSTQEEGFNRMQKIFNDQNQMNGNNSEIFFTIKDVMELDELQKFMDELFLDKQFKKAESLQLLDHDLWTMFGLNKSHDLFQFSKMTHRPVECIDKNTVAVEVCFQRNPTRIPGVIYEVAHIGKFSNEERLFRYRNIPKFGFFNGNEWKFTNNCTKKNDLFTCYVSEDECAKDFSKCKATSVRTEQTNTIVRPLLRSDIIATTLHEYRVIENGISSTSAVPKSGILQLQMHYKAIAVIGDLTIKGRDWRTTHVILNGSTDVSDLIYEDLKHLKALSDEEAKEIEALKEIAPPSFFHFVGEFFQKIINFFELGLIKILWYIVMLISPFIIVYCLLTKCLIPLLKRRLFQRKSKPYQPPPQNPEYVTKNENTIYVV